MENSLRLLNCSGLKTIFKRIVFFFLKFYLLSVYARSPFSSGASETGHVGSPWGCSYSCCGLLNKGARTNLGSSKEQEVLLTAEPTAQLQFSHLHCSVL